MDEMTKEFVKQGTKEVAKMIALAIEPPAKELGKLLAKPLELTNWLLDLLPAGARLIYRKGAEAWGKRQAKKLAEIPKKYQTVPHLNILIPAIEGVALNLDSNILTEMFSELIKNACDARTQDEVHPHHVNLLKTMSSMDAKVLYSLATIGFENRNVLKEFYVINPHVRVNGENDWNIAPTNYVPINFTPHDFNKVSESFIRLRDWGLVEPIYGEYSNQEQVKSTLDEFIKKITPVYKEKHGRDVKIEVELKHEFSLKYCFTETGAAFAWCVLPNLGGGK